MQLSTSCVCLHCAAAQGSFEKLRKYHAEAGQHGECPAYVGRASTQFHIVDAILPMLPFQSPPQDNAFGIVILSVLGGNDCLIRNTMPACCASTCQKHCFSLCSLPHGS